MQRAMRATGLSDWGDTLQDFRPGLARLMQSLDGESELNFIGRLMMRDYVQRLLVNRLKIARDLKQYPDIERVEIRRPLFIVGFPRTGSTLLQRLLARDPAARSLQAWEMMLPSPPPEAATYASDPRIKLADRRLRMLDWMAPEFSVAHEVVAGEPEECVSLLQTTLTSSCFELMARMPSYRDWLRTQDQTQPYRYYQRQLQLLQYRNARQHWVLKSPFHLLAIDALMQVFPDAVIVQTHRAPERVLPSLCSLFNAMHQLTSDRTDPRQLGSSMIELLAEANAHLDAAREKYPAERFMDVPYQGLVDDPVGTVRSIYTRFGYPLGDAALGQMQAWHGSNPQHRRGVHQYSLEQFGLTPADVERRFADYRRRYAAYL